MSYSLELPGLLAVSAPNLKDLETLIARALELRAENPLAAPIVPSVPMMASVGGAPVMVASADLADAGKLPNVAKWERLNMQRRRLSKPARLRMSAEEIAKYGEGEEARECAAKERLAAMGETLADGTQAAPVATGEAVGVTVEEGSELDEETLV